ncbi:hypothetical protein H5410_034670 [Solanum commersonii]|uniref:Uncharacterized protein n=1 Tax=Solanum commersonii TaxID=4109 RepID=A0A9J5YW52_SOLCO|nr:hypothetical protein H5410_034670 [Solanum commersonii]
MFFNLVGEKLTNLDSEKKQQALSMAQSNTCCLDAPDQLFRSREDRKNHLMRKRGTRTCSYTVLHCALDFFEDRSGHACTIYKCLMQRRSFEVERTQAIECY